MRGKDTGEPDESKGSRPVRREAVGKVPSAGQLVGGLPYELEALRCGVNPDISREELAALIESSTVMLPREEHKAGHESDFVR